MSGLVDLWWAALTLSEEAFVRVVEDPDARVQAYVIVLLAGAAELVGQSVLLFLNGVRPWRFALAMLLNATTFALEVVVWVIGIVVVEALFGVGEVPFGVLVAVVALGHAPYLLSVFLLIPYYGPPIQRLLQIWTVAAIGVGLAAVTEWTNTAIVVVLALGFAFQLVIKVTVGRWIGAIDRFLWRTATGTRWRLSVEDSVNTLRDRARGDARNWFRS